jgi:mRNA interferase MazF
MAGADDAPIPRRGEVWFADVPGDKRRPILVLSRDPMGGVLHSVICAPITSTIRGLATEVTLGREAGLVRPSVANFDNTFLLARRRLVRRLGRASRATMDAACGAMATAIGCAMTPLA